MQTPTREQIREAEVERGEPITYREGIGKELCDLLRKELSIPRGCKTFEVRFSVDDFVTVKCEYTPYAK